MTCSPSWLVIRGPDLWALHRCTLWFMAYVTVRANWSVAGLHKGEVGEVERTARVEELIARGMLQEVTDAPAVPSDPQGPPRRSASRDDWAEYLAQHTNIVTDGKTRPQLLEEWDALNSPQSDEQDGDGDGPGGTAPDEH